MIAGMMTNMCVDATVRAATDLGFQCLTAADACAARDLSYNNRIVEATNMHTAFLAALNGIYGKVLSAEQIIKKIVSSGRT